MEIEMVDNGAYDLPPLYDTLEPSTFGSEILVSTSEPPT